MIKSFQSHRKVSLNQPNSLDTLKNLKILKHWIKINGRSDPYKRDGNKRGANKRDANKCDASKRDVKKRNLSAI